MFSFRFQIVQKRDKNVRISDKFYFWNLNEKLDRFINTNFFLYLKQSKLVFVWNLNYFVPFSDIIFCPKTKPFCPVFRHLKIEPFHNQSILLCPKSEHVSDFIALLYCESNTLQGANAVRLAQLSCLTRSRSRVRYLCPLKIVFSIISGPRNPSWFQFGLVSKNNTSIGTCLDHNIYNECLKFKLVWISDCSVSSHFQTVQISDSVWNRNKNVQISESFFCLKSEI